MAYPLSIVLQCSTSPYRGLFGKDATILRQRRDKSDDKEKIIDETN